MKPTGANVIHFSMNTFGHHVIKIGFFTEMSENGRLKLSFGAIFGWPRFVSLILKKHPCTYIKSKKKYNATFYFLIIIIINIEIGKYRKYNK